MGIVSPVTGFAADKVGVDLVPDLFVGQFLCRAHQAIARVADHDIDPAERGPGAIDYATDRSGLGQVKLGQRQPVAMLGL
jgi:hypothetical protein